MSPATLRQRLDDALNPIVVKELRQAVQSRIVAAALFLFLGLQVLILGIVVLATALGSGPERVDYSIGREVFLALNTTLVIVCMLLIPPYTGVRLALERSDTNTDLLFISSLRPRHIIRGKFFAAVILLLLILSAWAPFLAFAYLLRGIDVPTIFFVLGVDFVTVLAGTAVAVLFGSIPGNWAVRIVFALVALNVLFSLAWTSIASVFGLLEWGGLEVDRWEFWAAAGTAAAAVLAVVGLFLSFAVALISPPSSNRAFPVRLAMLLIWILSAGIAAGWAYYQNDAAPVLVWLIVLSILYGLGLLIAIGERQHWSPRVARTIPRRWWARVPAFLLYSGAAGGIVYTALMIGLTVFAGIAAVELFGPRLSEEVVPRVVGVLALYVFAYCMVSLFLTRASPRFAARPALTFLVALVLLILGSLVPFLLGYFISRDDYFVDRLSNNPWWWIANPVAAAIEVGNRGRFQQIYFTCAASAAGLVTLLALPWFYRQWRRFRPPEPVLDAQPAEAPP